MKALVDALAPIAYGGVSLLLVVTVYCAIVGVRALIGWARRRLVDHR